MGSTITSNNRVLYTDKGEVYSKPKWSRSALAGVTGVAAAGSLYGGLNTVSGILTRKKFLNSLKDLDSYNRTHDFTLLNSLKKMYNNSFYDFAQKDIFLRDCSLMSEKSATRLFFKDMLECNDILENNIKYAGFKLDAAYIENHHPELSKKLGQNISRNYKSKHQNLFSRLVSDNSFIGKIKQKILKFRYKTIDKFASMYAKDVKADYNVFSIKGKAYVDMTKKHAVYLPHELGHCLNYKSKGLFGLISRLNGCHRKIVPLLILTTLLRRKKIEGEEAQTALGKGMDFVRDNIVGLTALSYVPKLADEASASYRGINMMKKYLPKYELKMLKGSFSKAWLTYAFNALAVMGGMLVLDKVKNTIDKPKKLENMENKKEKNRAEYNQQY